jgi:Bacterial Ig-like domain (group 3)/Right handed beta helix region
MKLAKFTYFILIAALALTGSVARAQANVAENESATLYVDAQSGSDSNSGTSASPLKTIQSAVNKANGNNQKSIGTRIVVNAGVYRETVLVDPVSGQTSVPLTIEAATTGTAIISGAEEINGWSPDPQYTGAYVANWTPTQSTCALPGGWPSVQPIVLRTEMVFVNGVAMTQVLSHSDLKPGTFFVDTTAGALHVFTPAGVDPSTATIEAGARAKTIGVVGRTNIVLRGLALTHAANCVNTAGATVTSSSNVLIDSVQANWNNSGGLGIFSSTNVTVQNSIANYNGAEGMMGAKSQTTLYTNNETDYNNWRGAQGAFYDWAMGGAKFFQMRTTTVLNHFSYNNQAQGLWFDTDNKNITINNATLVGSYNAALQLERNEGPITLENSHLCSSGSGLNLLTTEGLTVNNNVFYNNGATNKFQAQIYLAGTAGGINITDWQTGQVYDLFTKGTVLSGNSFVDQVPGQFVFGTYLSGTDWTDFTSTLTSGSNTWYDPSTANAFRIINGKNVNLSGWQTATGTDYSSVWASPSATAAASCAAPAASYPDFNVNLDSGSYTMSSGRATATVHVNSFNFGTVNLSVSGLPAGVTASFSSPSLNSGFSILTLSASSTSTSAKIPVTLWAVSGDRVHNATFNLTVNPNPSVVGTITALTTSASSIAQNSPVTMTATVTTTSGSTVPTGSITFYDGGTALGTGTLSSGVATITTSTLPVGNDSLTAVYAGTSTFNASTSSAVDVTVNSASVNSTTTLSASATSVTQNSPVTLTAVVKATTGTSAPTGSVTFYNGSTTIGTANLSGGSASISSASLPVGSDSITAVYSGTASIASSTSNAVTVSVNSAVVSTTTSLSASTSTITQGALVTFTATVAQSSGTTIPTGSVSFYNGTALLGSASLASGVASISTSALPSGTVSVSAAYSGAVAFNASSSSIVVVTVNPAPPAAVNTATALTASVAAVTQNSPVTLVATVRQASGTTAPTGTVTFLNGGTAIGTGTLTAGAATLITSSLSVGTAQITASYSGASSFNPSASNPVSIVVNPNMVATTTSLTTTSGSITQNSSVTLTAKVSPSSGSSVVAGNVTFLSGSSVIGTAPLSGGVASLTTTTLPAGTDALVASYPGSSLFSASSSSPVSITVSPALVNTSVVLSASSLQVDAGSSVTLTATVKSVNGLTPSIGSIDFFNGSASLGTAQVVSGVAKLSTSALATGTDTVTAKYIGTSTFSSSTSSMLSITVKASPVSTETSLSVSSASVVQDSSVAFTATVKASSGSTNPSGTVTFYSGSTAIGTANLSAGTATVSNSSLPQGLQSITAVYSGSSSFLTSSSNAVSIKITPKPSAPVLINTNTTVSSSAVQADQGFTISLTATVVPSSGTAAPTGGVVFTVGQKQIGTSTLSNGKAYLATAALPTGQDNVIASYAGNSSFAASSSTAVTVKISGPDFAVKATPASISAKAGQTVNTELLITPENGFNQVPQLGCTGLPDGTTCSFAKPVKQSDGTSTVSMTIHTSPTTAESHGQPLSQAPFALAFLPLLFWLSSRQRKEFRRLLSLSMLAVAIVFLGGSAIGCGGKATSSSGATSAAQSTVNITVTAQTTTGISHTTNVQLTLM